MSFRSLSRRLEPRDHALGASRGDQLDPVSAFVQVMAICLETPPWERDVASTT